MKALDVKISSSLLIIALMTSSVAAKSLHKENKKVMTSSVAARRSHKEIKNVMTSSVAARRSHKEIKNGGRTLVLGTKNSTKEGDNQDITGTRKNLAHNVFNEANHQCYKQFFVGGKPPVGLRGNLHNMKYICQQLDQQENQQIYYGTMFDEGLGIPLFSAYTLAHGDVKFKKLKKNIKWKKTKGITRQGSYDIFPPIPYHKGHLVPGKTFSTTEERKESTYRFTNAVPQRPGFNGGMWSKYENKIRKYAEKICTPEPKNGRLYLLTGTSFAQILPSQGNNQVQAIIPSPIQITRMLPSVGDNPGIDIPKSMWTAGCCVAENGNVESFAVIGNNHNIQEGLLTRQISVANLQSILQKEVTVKWSGANVNLNLFPGNPNCVNPYNTVKVQK